MDRILVLDWDGTLAFSSAVTALRPTSFRTGEEDPLRDALAGWEAEAQAPYHLETGESEPAELSIDRNGVQVPTRLYLRPYAVEFLAWASRNFRLVLWSFGVAEYLRQCLEWSRLGAYFNLVIPREKMPYPMKDLFLVDQGLKNIAIADDNNHTFGLLNPYHCIDVPTWTPSMPADRALQALPQMVEFHFGHILDRFTSAELVALRNTLATRWNARMQDPEHARDFEAGEY